MAFHFKGRSIGKIGVVGSGQIGPDIALYFSKVFAADGVQIVVVDVVQAALDKGKDKLVKKIKKGGETGAFTPEQSAQMIAAVAFTTDYDQLRGADLIVEAATENKELKRKIFAQLESLVSEHCLLASNSSHLEPEEIFANLKNKKRSLVIHYFFPAERNVMVEVVPGKDTDKATAQFAMELYETMGKVPIRVGSRYGYALDPVFEGMFLAAVLCVDEGLGTVKEVDAVAQQALGLGVGPFTAMNLTGGNPITAHGLDQYTSKIMPWYKTPQRVRDAVKNNTAWDVPQRGEKVDVEPARRANIENAVRGAYFGIVCEIVDSGITNVDDLDMGAELGLAVRAPFQFMNEMGVDNALKLVEQYASTHPGFKVADCLKKQAASGRPWTLRTVLREDRGDVAVLTIRRPKVLNALNQAVFDEIAEAFSALKQDKTIKGVVLTGHGKKAFVAGADVNMLAAIQSPKDGEATSWHSQQALMAVENLGKPVVCAFNGLAFGGGHELALACTARIARRGLEPLAAQPEPNLGIIPGAGATQRLTRLIGLEKAAGMLRLGKPVSGKQALALGLILKEVDGDSLIDEAVQLARDLAAGKTKVPPIRRAPLDNVPDSLHELPLGHLSKAVDAVMCKAILGGARKTLEEGLRFESQCFGEVCALKDMRIGVENFLKNGPKSKAAFIHG